MQSEQGPKTHYPKCKAANDAGCAFNRPPPPRAFATPLPVSSFPIRPHGPYGAFKAISAPDVPGASELAPPFVLQGSESYSHTRHRKPALHVLEGTTRRHTNAVRNRQARQHGFRVEGRLPL